MTNTKGYSPTWILGGGGGIGFEIAKQLAEQNTKLLVSSRRGISNNMSLNLKEITSCIGDLEDYTEMLRHISKFKSQGYDIEFIYFCVHRPFIPLKVDTLKWSSIQEQITGCVKPFNNLIKAITEGKLNKLKSVLCLTTNTIQFGDDMFAHRNIAKGTLESYIKVISKTENFAGISFNGIALGYVDTPQLKDYLKKLAEKNAPKVFIPDDIASISDVATCCITAGHRKWKNNRGKIFHFKNPK